MPTPTAVACPPIVTAQARWLEGESFVTRASSGHGLVVDSDRKSNLGPGPMELVLMGLCACSATDVVMILGKARQGFVGLEVEAEGRRAQAPPAVYTAIHVRYRVRGRELDAAVVERAIALSHDKYCSVLLMLQHTAAITRETLIEPVP